MSPAQPEQSSTAALLAEAQQALGRGAWTEARRLFEAVLAGEVCPEALEGLGAAAWWLEDPPAVFAARERAYLLFQERDDRRAAGRLATALGYDYAVFRAERAVSNGWLQRAHRLLDGLDPGPEQILLALTEAELAYHGEGDMERVRQLAGRARDLASRLNLFDLEMLALAVEGLALVGRGEVADGMRRLDEATAAAVAGEMETFQGVASTLCVMVLACDRVRDVDRASQWCDHFMEFCRRKNLQAQLDLCRVFYASVLIARGRWDEAERQLAEALEGLRCRIAWSLPALERLGELRRRQGRLDEAESLFDQIALQPAGSLGLARLALDRGEHELAQDQVQKLLRRFAGPEWPERPAALELLIRIHCARGETESASQALRELEALAERVGTDFLLALVDQARGQVAHAARHLVAAKDHLEDSLDRYQRNRLPFEAALVRLELGRALQALGRRGPAQDQVQAARDTLHGLGAAGLVAVADALLAQLAQPAGTAAGAGALTAREIQVLELLTRGLSNEAIAAELVLSKHTVRRHVSNILTKLNVASRTAAAVYALERQRA